MVNLVLFLLTFVLVSFDPPGCVTICHKPGTPAEQTMCVSPKAVAGHLGHGDYLGACSAKALPTATPVPTEKPVPTVTPTDVPTIPTREPPPTAQPIDPTPTSTSSKDEPTPTSPTPEEAPAPTPTLGQPPVVLPISGGMSLVKALAIFTAGSGLVALGRFLRRK